MIFQAKVKAKNDFLFFFIFKFLLKVYKICMVNPKKMSGNVWKFPIVSNNVQSTKIYGSETHYRTLPPPFLIEIKLLCFYGLNNY